ncbi:Pentatricopeptide repeat-containing protein At1g09900 [Linum perenne]
MDSVLPTHEAFPSLQHLGTLRNGGFVTDKPKNKPPLSLRSRRITSISSSMQTPPPYTSHRNRSLADGQSSWNGNVLNLGRNRRLWKLIHNGQLEMAFTFFKNMVSSGEIPGRLAYRRLIRDLCKARRIGIAAQVIEALESCQGLAPDYLIYTELVEALCEAREIDDALNLFNRMYTDERCCNPDVVAYNILINALFRERRFDQAMKLVDEMKSRGCEPTEVTCSTVVNAMCTESRFDEAVKFLNSYGSPPCTVSYNIVLNGLCSVGRFNDAEKLLPEMASRKGCSPSAVTFRILIHSLSNKGLSSRAMEWLDAMPKYGCTPDPFHYNPVIVSLCREKKMEMAIEYTKVMKSSGCNPNITIYNTLLAGWWGCDNVDAAVELFTEILTSSSCSPNVATYRISIEGLSRFRRIDEALELFGMVRRMKGYKLNIKTYATLILGLIKDSRVDEAMEVLDEMKRLQPEVHGKYYNMIVSELCKVGEIDLAIDVFVYMVLSGCKPENATYAGLIEGIARAGFGEEGMELMNELLLRGAELVEALCEAREIDNALNLFNSMYTDERCCNPDVVAYNILINALFRERRFDQAMKLLDEMKSRGCELTEVTCSTVVNAMCTESRFDEAVKFLNSYGSPPCTVSYNIVLNALCSVGRFNDAEKLLPEMASRKGCSPSAVTFRILIHSLSNKGLSSRAMEWLDAMPKYGCTPDPFQYNPVIVSLCREKKMEMAIEYTKVMKSRGCNPNITIYNSLLSGWWWCDNVDAAVELLTEMLTSSNCSPNVATYRISIEGLSRFRRIDEALELFGMVRRMKGYKLNIKTYAMLIVGLIKDSRVDEAMEVLDELKRIQPEVHGKYYNMIVSELCKVGEIDLAIDVFVYMVLNGCKPENATYAELIEGIARAGFGEEGMELMNELLLRGAMDKGWSKNVAARIERICR